MAKKERLAKSATFICENNSWRNSFSHIFRRLLLGWLIGTLIEFLLLPHEVRELSGTECFGLMSPLRVLLIACGVLGMFTILSPFYSLEKWEKWGMISAFLLLWGVALRTSFRWSFFGAGVLCLGILLVYCLKGRNETEICFSQKEKKEKNGHGAHVFMMILTGLFFLFVSAWTVARVYSFSAPTYDFGIFSQMFYSMKERGVPITTLERDGALSHFAVHVSPVYYLLLPFYVLAPYPVTLQILQAAVMASAVIPLWKLGKHYGLGQWQRVLLCMILLLYPAFSGGAGYDIHENCFLTPFLLWLFYAIEKEKTALTFTLALLTLTVKEDAGVYVGVIALWLLLRSSLKSGKKNRKNLITGLCLLAVAVVWFFGVTTYLKNRGDGVMSSRYKNFMENGEGSLLLVVCNVFLHPMKVLYECSDPEKLRYLALTMVPLLGLPLLTRRYERYILLIPYILVNLMSDYTYQHEIFYQYSFGSTAFLLYLTLVNLKDIRIEWGKTSVLSAMVILCSVVFGLLIVPKAMTYPKIWITEKESLTAVRQTLSRIPEDATVTASTFYTVELSQRQIIYDLGYASREHLLESEYVVLQPEHSYSYKKYATAGKDNGLENLLSLLEKKGYEEVAAVENRLSVYKRTETS